MFRTILLLLTLTLFFACKPRKADLSGDEVPGVEDFLASFPSRSLPYMLTDTQLMRKASDSFLINPKTVKSFLPDSVFRPDFKKGEKVVFHALGSVSAEEGETYLFIRAAATGRTVAYVACFDKEGVFRVAMPVVRAEAQKGLHADMLMDGRFTITRNRSRKGPGGEAVYSKDAYVYNSAGVFTLVLTESNETVEDDRIYDPIDTLPRKNPLSGNYVLSRRNFITVRDGRAADRLLFFIHMEKEGGACTGELKGELDVVKPGIARYSRADDHCTLEFTFRGNAVAVRELEACGNHRSTGCEIEGSYPKRREPKRPDAGQPKKK